MNVSEIREKFLSYFESKGHTRVASSSLVPGNDPTLLFTNSGMVQFKDVFVGTDTRSYKRATSSQRSVRTGGKHNDLENVGYTARHHTFFEMLGNFSFGDYFKHDAIKFAWELLTGVYGLPKDKLWVTVYIDDDEAFNIWADEIGVPKERIVRIGDNKGAKYASDNFWQMADTGPCGPCSEIFYDHGPEVAGGPPGSPDADGDRYIEIWNLVFMQFDRQANGEMPRLPKPCVDTGMGLERIAAVLQHVHSNYEIDLFVDLIKAAGRETHTKDLNHPSLKVIADHIRACAFLIVDGVIPSNDGRGYVLRRIIRRAVRHGYKLGQKKPFFHRLVVDLSHLMGEAYPELPRTLDRVVEVLRVEEERFYETIERGMGLLERSLTDEALVIGKLRRIYNPLEIGIDGRSHQSATGLSYSYDARFTLHNHDAVIVEVKKYEETPKPKLLEHFKNWVDFFAAHGDSFGVEEVVYVLLGETPETFRSEMQKIASQYKTKVKLLFVDKDVWPSYQVLDGRIAFTLHDTYGFPLDLTSDVARERGISVDEEAFDAAMEEQRQGSRTGSKFKSGERMEYSGAKTVFTGYESLSSESAQIVALYHDGTFVEELGAGDRGIVVLNQTPFYAESGGQVGDKGELTGSGGGFEVSDTEKIQPDVFGHHGVVKAGRLKIGDTVEAKVDIGRRAAIARNHSVTHLMHKALREVLGGHVAQRGSLVDDEKTRFDFVQNKPLTLKEIREVEEKVNAEILLNTPTRARVLPIEEAKQTGAMMLFDEKYGEEVRVLDIGSSRELCGGTHVGRTGDIGPFKISYEGGVAAGIRRVEATTGATALHLILDQTQELSEIARSLKVGTADVENAIVRLQEERRAMEKELAKLKGKLASSQGDELIDQAIDVGGIKVLAATLEGADSKALLETMDKLKDKLKTAAIVLSAVNAGKVVLVAGVTKDATAKIKAGDLLNFVAQQVGGKGGGKPELAQGSGSDPDKLPAALKGVQAWVQERV